MIRQYEAACHLSCVAKISGTKQYICCYFDFMKNSLKSKQKKGRLLTRFSSPLSTSFCTLFCLYFSWHLLILRHYSPARLGKCLLPALRRSELLWAKKSSVKLLFLIRSDNTSKFFWKLILYNSMTWCRDDAGFSSPHPLDHGLTLFPR